MENNENTYHGIPGTRFIWHGEWSDPEVEYQGKLYNGNSLEDTLWSIYRTECEADGKGPSEEEYDNLPTDWFTDNFLDIIMEDMNESKNVKKSVIKLNEEQLRKVVAESVKRVLNEISYGVARDAFKKAGENFDKDWSLYKNPRKMAQLKNLHQHFVDRSAENFNPEMPVLVCFDDHCENFKAEDLEQYFEVTGFVEPSPNPIYADQRMIGYPKLKGFIGPMWDGNKLRYETQKVYDMLST